MRRIARRLDAQAGAIEARREHALVRELFDHGLDLVEEEFENVGHIDGET